MKCKKIQKQEKFNLQLKNKKQQKLKEKGITLIALVVTIIILLILAGVTLNMALSGDGLFSRARNAADKYKKAQEDEAKLISEIGKEMNSEYVGAFVTGYNPTKKIDYVIEASTSGIDEEQKFSTEEGMKWRIWDYDGTTLRLISDKPTEQTLTLKEKAGYNNGVWVMNEICRQCYTMDEVEGITVRNLRRSDIEAVSNYDYTKSTHEAREEEVLDEEEDLIYYGETRKYKENNQSPAMWSNHDDTWTYKYDKATRKGTGDKSVEIPWEQEYEIQTETEDEGTTEEIKVTQSSYVRDITGKQGEFKDMKYYNMLFRNEKGTLFGVGYWLGTRMTDLYKSSVIFGIGVMATFNKDQAISVARVFGSDR